MRIALLAIGTLVAGTGAGVNSGVFPIPPQTLQAIRALGGDPSQLKTIEVAPIRAVYDNVARQIATPEDPRARLGYPGPVVVEPNVSAMGTFVNRPLPGVPNGLGANVAAQTRQFNDRMRDLRAYAGNPAAWHGAPPH